MPGERIHRLSHTLEVAAPASTLYALIADPERWPLYLPRSVYAQRLDFDGVNERVRLWALAEGRIVSWTACRTQDPVRRLISFRQDVLMEPATSMAGCWSVRPLAPGRCRLTLEHEFTAAPGRPQDALWLAQVTADNTRSTLRSLQFLAERWSRLDELALSFAESVRVKGPAELVYGFLYDVADWPGQLPHVRRAALEEPHLGIQKVALELTAADGGPAPGVAGIRICFPHAGRIVHKATVPRPLLAAHCGEWSVLPDERGVTVVAQHHALLREDRIEQVLGAGATLAEARRRIRADLARDSRQILQLARRHAESAIRVL
ncbi:aromatase/cyclase [Streptomyces sp. Je 1-369]|uniref:aromatase/cyclase n=1 Tax=Streptomyces sp. Je 1-369 TaxID=2966192 RepID=UPI0022854633|nr:SRPBCC family protein [Streptomyces sp. Je 1-369]WAL93146.1 SRPBCC family protein [Streptomyces sp. Je 1-369]WAL99834.1 SRPBCC family protein [Streptomyces sp. Je 1-369]